MIFNKDKIAVQCFYGFLMAPWTMIPRGELLYENIQSSIIDT